MNLDFEYLAAFLGYDLNVLKGEQSIKMKMKILDTCIIPTLVCGAQSWSMTKEQYVNIKKMYFRILKSITGIRVKDKVRLSEIIERTGTNDIGWKVKKLKLNFVGHVVRKVKKWGKLAEEWSSYNWKRKNPTPPTRWRDEMVKSLGILWKRVALDRKWWKRTVDAHAQLWVCSMEWCPPPHTRTQPYLLLYRRNNNYNALFCT